MCRMSLLLQSGIVILLTLVPLQAVAAAWTLEKDSIAIYTNAFYYSTNAYFNEDSKRQNQPRYRKYELNIYSEYGWTDELTLGTSFSLDAVHGDAGVVSTPSLTGNIQTRYSMWNYGLSDPSLFLRWRIWENESTVLSVQPWLKLPSLYLRDSLPRGGTTQSDMEMRLLGGHSFEWNNQYHFVNLESGYRKRFGHPSDQLRADISVGFRLSAQLMILSQLFTTWRLNVPDMTRFTQNTADDYNLVKPQLSAVYQLTQHTHLQAGAFYHAYGRNTGNGSGLLLSVWHRL